MKFYRMSIAASFAACLVVAGYEISQIEWSGAPKVCQGQRPDPMAVERSFADETGLIASGDKDSALLGLRKKAQSGPNEGEALYLLGELALDEKAYAQALEFWQQALKKSPYLSDRQAPFGAGDKMLAALNGLKSGPMKGRDDADMKRLNQLIRRLSGGCQ